MHTAVLLNEVTQMLDPKPGAVIVDGTIGYGGHAEALIKLIGSDGTYLGIDKDPSAMEYTRGKLSAYGSVLRLVQDDFKNLGRILEGQGIASVDGILLDLGVSSEQLDNPQRGFSFRSEARLGMRMDQQPGMPGAFELINKASEHDLLKILYEYGEERFAKQIVRRILEKRRVRAIESTTQLVEIISEAVPGFYRHGRIHPATKTFQALRIAVNGELESLEFFLQGVLKWLGFGGKLAIISFHSLEDRPVKQIFRDWQQQGFGKVLTKKPIIATQDEINRNSRARSAKLRVFEKNAKEN